MCSNCDTVSVVLEQKESRTVPISVCENKCTLRDLYVSDGSPHTAFTLKTSVGVLGEQSFPKPYKVLLVSILTKVMFHVTYKPLISQAHQLHHTIDSYKKTIELRQYVAL